MILRRITEAIKNQHWTTFLFELIILVAGVYIGIYLGEIQSEREHARETDVALAALESELRSDLVRLDEIIAFQTNKATDQHRIVELLSVGHIDEKALNELIESMLGTNDTFFPNRSAYRAMQTGGFLAALPDTDLRLRITRLFEREYARQDVNAAFYDEKVFAISSTTLAEFWDRVDQKLIADRPDAAIILRNGVLVVLDQADYYLGLITGTVRPEIVGTLEMIDVYQAGRGN